MSEIRKRDMAILRTPDNDMFLTPVYPYNDTILQFSVLQRMGYPVELQVLDTSELGDTYAHDEFFQWEKGKYPTWVRPIVRNLDFEDWVETPDVPGDQIKLGDDMQDLIYNHPMQIVSDVTKAQPDMIVYFLEELEEKGCLPHMYHEGLITEEFLQKCLVAAYEVFQEREEDPDFPAEDDDYDFGPDEYTVHLYEQLKFRDVEPVHPEELMALYEHYYQLVEQLCPEFKAFKTAQT